MQQEISNITQTQESKLTTHPSLAEDSHGLSSKGETSGR